MQVLTLNTICLKFENEKKTTPFNYHVINHIISHGLPKFSKSHAEYINIIVIQTDDTKALLCRRAYQRHN